MKSREVIAEIFHEAKKPSVHGGFVFCCSFAATFFPMIHCPCTNFPAWLFPLSIVGAVCWFGAASFMAVASETTEERVVWVIFSALAPLAYVFVEAGFAV